MTELAELRFKLLQIKLLHTPYWKPAMNDTTEEYCSECRKHYPCPTKKILDQGE